MCILSQSTDPCGHFECFLALSGFASMCTDKLAHRVLSVLETQNQLLAQLLQHNTEMESVLDGIGSSARTLQTQKTDSPAPLDIAANTEADWTCELILMSELPNPIFKEKGFGLVLRMSSLDQCDKCLFSVSLYSQEEPPKPVSRNIVGTLQTGKKALRGTLQARPDDQGWVRFSNIVVNEVSSHYVNDGFFLVVADHRRPEVRPLILKGVTVRARKSLRHS